MEPCLGSALCAGRRFSKEHNPKYLPNLAAQAFFRKSRSTLCFQERQEFIKRGEPRDSLVQVLTQNKLKRFCAHLLDEWMLAGRICIKISIFRAKSAEVT